MPELSFNVPHPKSVSTPKPVCLPFRSLTILVLGRHKTHQIRNRRSGQNNKISRGLAFFLRSVSMYQTGTEETDQASHGEIKRELKERVKGKLGKEGLVCRSGGTSEI